MKINDDNNDKIILESVSKNKVEYLCKVADREGVPVFVQFSENIGFNAPEE